MSRHVAFLRGMNLGGRRIKNPELCACFEAMGFTEVGAFLASGNVIFEVARKPRGGLEAKIERGLEEQLGYPVPTFVRSADEVRAIAAYRPFSAEAITSSEGKLQVVLLAEKPSRAVRERVLGHASEDDHLALDGRELYWLPCGRMSDSELNLRAIEKALGEMTIRTRRTVERIAATKL
jgi:uncharacterized protein (DUF1697 family)